MIINTKSVNISEIINKNLSHLIKNKRRNTQLTINPKLTQSPSSSM